MYNYDIYVQHHERKTTQGVVNLEGFMYVIKFCFLCKQFIVVQVIHICIFIVITRLKKLYYIALIIAITNIVITIKNQTNLF